jgi:hypothetical protein
MGSVPPLPSFLLVIVSGWIHRHQLLVIEFLQAENQLLKRRLRGKRIRFTDAERALLARKAKAVGRKALLELDTVVSPDTLFRWHRQFVALNWNFTHRRGPGRATNHVCNIGVDRAHGAGQPGVGIHPHSGSAGQSQTQRWSRDHCQCVEAQWD